jgi:large subunit ribosomal protein L5
MTRLREAYNKTIQKSLGESLGLKNRYQIPALEKVIINIGVGEAKDNQKLLDEIINNLTIIAGQKPVVTKAKTSIAGFKIRTGQSVGVRVTLRGDRMYDFLDKLVSITFPRVRDFRGLSLKSFDGNGNYNIGLREQSIFPEIHFDLVNKVHGMNITITTSAKTDEQAKALLTQLGFPFEKE